MTKGPLTVGGGSALGGLLGESLAEIQKDVVRDERRRSVEKALTDRKLIVKRLRRIKTRAKAGTRIGPDRIRGAKIF